jgi:hypothetical protein
MLKNCAETAISWREMNEQRTELSVTTIQFQFFPIENGIRKML